MAVALAALTWHAAAIGFTLIPFESQLRKRLAPPMDFYRKLTGIEQHWNMFETVPYHRDYTVAVGVTQGSANTSAETGPILPGLAPFPEYFRYHTFMTRLESKEFDMFLEPYARHLGEEILRAHPGATRFEIRKQAERIQDLELIRDLGKVSRTVQTVHGPYPLPFEKQ